MLNEETVDIVEIASESRRLNGEEESARFSGFAMRHFTLFKLVNPFLRPLGAHYTNLNVPCSAW